MVSGCGWWTLDLEHADLEGQLLWTWVTLKGEVRQAEMLRALLEGAACCALQCPLAPSAARLWGQGD